MGQVSSWKVFAVVFLRIWSKFELNSSVHDNSMPASCCVVQDCNEVQTRKKEFLSIILLPAALFYQVERYSCPHITRTSTQPAVLLFAPSISLMTVLSGLYFLVIVAPQHKLTTLSFVRRKHDILVRTYSVFYHTYNLCLHVQVRSTDFSLCFNLFSFSSDKAI